MRIVVTGGAGFVGKGAAEFPPAGQRGRGGRYAALRHGWLKDGPGLCRVDIRDAAAVRAVIDEFRPDVVVARRRPLHPGVRR